MNNFYGDAETWRKYATSESNSKPTPKPADPEPAKKTNEQLADEVLEGKWDNGEARKKKLTEAGYNYQAVQDIVNKKLGINKEPKAEYYTIQKGDTLTKIAKKYGTQDD